MPLLESAGNGDTPVAQFSRALTWVGRQVADGPLPVAVFGVADSSGIRMIETFGGARDDDHFALFSITKPLVGLAAARAIENGTLSLQRPLSSVVPEFGTQRTDEVRLEHLLSHTAGIADPALDSAVPLTRSLLGAGQEFEAGTRVLYSNIAFQGVAAMLEDATGRSVVKSVESLAASGLTFDPAAERHPVVGGAELGFDMSGMTAQPHPAAGAFGTARALLTIGSSLLRGDSAIVAPGTLAGMLIPRTIGLADHGAVVQRKDYGLSWHLRSSSTGLLERNAFGHAGLSATQWWIYPERDAAFVLLTNLLDAPSWGIDADELNNAFVTDLG